MPQVDTSLLRPHFNCSAEADLNNSTQDTVSSRQREMAAIAEAWPCVFAPATCQSRFFAAERQKIAIHFTTIVTNSPFFREF
jgi:hypothetical protein